jgi:hypothetical protein
MAHEPPAAIIAQAALTPQDEQALAQNERLMQQASLSYVVQGRCLRTIHTQQLWRGGYVSFEEYCRTRWDLGLSYAYDVMAAADVANQLIEAGIPQDRIPKNVHQCVELSRVKDPEARVATWEAIDRESGECVTREVIKQHVRARILEDADAAPPPETAKEPLPEYPVLSDREVRGTEDIPSRRPETEGRPDGPHYERLPLHDQIPEVLHETLDRQAALWREVEPSLKSFRLVIRKKLQEYLDEGGLDLGVAGELRRMLTIEGPGGWRVCRAEDGGCGGIGTTPFGDCTRCGGLGFRIPYRRSAAR